MIRAATLCIALLCGPAHAQTDPVLLPEAEQPAWNAVGRVNIAGLNRSAMCTGTLIAADLVLTAAHCVFRGETLARAADVHFVAGYRGGDYVAHSVAAELFVDPEYDPTLPPLASETRYDIAFLRLATPFPAETVAPLPLAALPDPSPPLALVGYRRDRAHALSRQGPCTITHREPAQIGLDCPVIPGASGGPVLWLSPEGWRVVALVSASVEDSGDTRALAPLVPLHAAPKPPAH
jgi:V8-like Glu-specific endopeptidase